MERNSFFPRSTTYSYRLDFHDCVKQVNSRYCHLNLRHLGSFYDSFFLQIRWGFVCQMH